MSENMFGLSTIKPKRAVAKQIDLIAKQHGAYLVEATIPGDGYKRWFCSPNYGDASNDAIASRVYDHLRRAQIYDADGNLRDKARQ